MITIRNDGYDFMRVRHTETQEINDLLRPGEQQSYIEIIGGSFMVEHEIRRLSNPRYDARGGDPYNRVGSRAFA